MTFSKHFFVLSATAVLMFGCDGRQAKNNSADGSDATFFVDPISITDVSTLNKDSFGLPKTKLYNFSACMQDLVLRSPVLFTKFAISDGAKELEVTTDHTGCLLWTETHDVNSQLNETVFKVKRTFVARELHSGRVTLDLAFNPWKDDPSALMDLRKQKPGVPVMVELQQFGFQDDPSNIPSTNGKSWSSSPESSKVPSSPANGPGSTSPSIWSQNLDASALTQLGDLTFIFTGRDYKNYRITPLLSLEPAHKYLVAISPQIYRKALNGTLSAAGIKSGSFRVKLLIVKTTAAATPKPEDVISVSDEVFTSDSFGNFRKEISLRFKDAALATSRMNILVSIEAVAENNQASIRPNYFHGTLSPRAASSASVTLVEDPVLGQNFSQLFAESVKKVSDIPVHGLAFYTKQSKAKALAANTQVVVPGRWLNDDVKFNVAELLKSYIQQQGRLSSTEKKNFQRALCAHFYPGTPAHRCASGFEENVLVQRVRFVERIVSPYPTPLGFPRQFSLSISNSMDFSKSDSSEHGATVSASLGADVGASIGLNYSKNNPVGGSETTSRSQGVGGSLKASVGGNLFASRTWRTANSTSTSGSTSQTQSISALALSFGLVADTKTCVVITALAQSQTQPQTQSVPTYLCEDTLRRENLKETYYLLNESQDASVLTDPDSIEGARWRMVIRGSAEFSVFEKIVSDKNLVIEFYNLSEKIKDQTLPPEFGINQIYPGIPSEPLP